MIIGALIISALVAGGFAHAACRALESFYMTDSYQLESAVYAEGAAPEAFDAIN